MLAPLPDLPATAAARRLQAADLPWATALLAEAAAGHPALPYVSAAPAAHRWLLGRLLACAVRYGGAYANAPGTALVLWLGPGLEAATWHLRLRLLPAAAWRLGWAATRRLRHLLRTESWLRRQSVAGPHHLLLALAVAPTARGRGEGHRLLAATLALRRAGGLPCYTGSQLPTQLPFYQRHGFGLAGHCAVGSGAAGALHTWSLLRNSALAG